MPPSTSLPSSSLDPSDSIQPPQMRNQHTSVPTISLVSSYITGEAHTIQNICSNSISNLFTQNFYIYICKNCLEIKMEWFSTYNKIKSQLHLDIINIPHNSHHIQDDMSHGKSPVPFLQTDEGVEIYSQNVTLLVRCGWRNNLNLDLAASEGCASPIGMPSGPERRLRLRRWRSGPGLLIFTCLLDITNNANFWISLGVYYWSNVDPFI